MGSFSVSFDNVKKTENMQKHDMFRDFFVKQNSKPSYKGAFNNYVDKMRGGGGQKMSVFVHT